MGCIRYAEEVTPRVAQPARILLIDDEQRVLRFVSRGLRAEGYTVDSADDGTDGLRMAFTGGYDLIILDLLMPGMDGRTVLRRIVRKLPSQQVMIVSCLTETATKVRCFEVGAGDYLAKPFSLEELLARVQAHLRVLARSRTPTTLRAGRLRLDMVRREADSGSGPHLIRPDGYLAASGVDSIEAYLRRVFVSPLLPALTLGKRASGSWMSH